MTNEEAISQLNDIKPGDTEANHGLADSILIAFLEDNGHKDLAKAWNEADTRCGFWYA